MIPCERSTARSGTNNVYVAAPGSYTLRLSLTRSLAFCDQVFFTTGDSHLSFVAQAR